MSYIAQQYAKLLDEEDILRLFGQLEGILRNKKDAAEKCRLTRKAINDWKGLKQGMKVTTKEKVLEQSLEYSPVETMEYLTRKLVDSSSNVLVTYLMTLYEMAVRTKDKSQFLELANRFEQASERYKALINKKNERQIDDLTVILRKHSKIIGSTWTGSSLNSSEGRLHSEPRSIIESKPELSAYSQTLGEIPKIFVLISNAGTATSRQEVMPLESSEQWILTTSATTQRKSPNGK